MRIHRKRALMWNRWCWGLDVEQLCVFQLLYVNGNIYYFHTKYVFSSTYRHWNRHWHRHRYRYGNIHISAPCFTPVMITLFTFLSKTLIPCVWLCHHSVTKYSYSVLCYDTLIHFYLHSRNSNMNYILISQLLICRFIASVLGTDSRMWTRAQ